MKTHLIVPFFVLVAVCGLLIWRAGDDEQFLKAHAASAAVALPAPAQVVRLARVDEPEAPPAATAQPAPAASDPWPNTEVVNRLRAGLYDPWPPSPAVHRAAIAEVLPVLATNQDVQLLVGEELISHGDLIDGLAWQLLACMYCTPVDKRLGDECVAEGLCDPNLAYIDVLRRDFGEQAVADALVRMEEIQARISINDPSALAIFTEIDHKRFPKEVGECVQLRTPTPECPPEEILRQTQAAYDYE